MPGAHRTPAAQPRLPDQRRHLHRAPEGPDSTTSPKPIDTTLGAPSRPCATSSNRLRLDYPPPNLRSAVPAMAPGASEPRPLRPPPNQNASPAARRHRSQRILPPRRVLCAPHHRSCGPRRDQGQYKKWPCPRSRRRAYVRARVLRHRGTPHPLALAKMRTQPSADTRASASRITSFSVLHGPARTRPGQRLTAHLAMHGP